MLSAFYDVADLIHIAVKLKEKGKVNGLGIRIFNQYPVSVLDLAEHVLPEILRYHRRLEVTVVAAIRIGDKILHAVCPEDQLMRRLGRTS